LAATPTLQVRPVASRTRERMSRAIVSPSPKSRRLPLTSRKASSMLMGCTSGV